MKFEIETLSYDLLQEHAHAALKFKDLDRHVRITVLFPLKVVGDQPESRIKERAIEELQRILWAAADSLTPEGNATLPSG